MRSIMSKLLGYSPFIPLKHHMAKVSECVKKVEQIFIALENKDYATIERLSSEVEEAEHAADLAKNEIRNNLSKRVYLPVDKGGLLEILALQDTIADRCEDIGILLNMKKLELPEFFKQDFWPFFRKNVEAFQVAQAIIDEFDRLIETSFGGFEAEKVKQMTDEVAFKEHEVDLLQRQLLKQLFSVEELDPKMPYTTFFLWSNILKLIESISNTSEKLGHRIRAMLDIESSK